MNSIIIIGIESSCDDTGIGVIIDGKIAANITYTQQLHKEYGGVVPEVASRQHLKTILPIFKKALNIAKIDKRDISAIGVTQGPGLLGSLMVGLSFAKGLSLSLGVPLIGINHMKAHILSHFIEAPSPEFPFLCLTVSGGHTQILRINSHDDIQLLGQTLDDAAGEAFDKSGKLLGLDYPAGVHIDELAKLGQPIIPFPKPKVDGLDFSFSGLKTAILYHLKKELKNDPNYIIKNKENLCRSIQDTIVDILIDKLKMASDVSGIKNIAIAGGVSANSGLRAALSKTALDKNWQIYVPKMEYCTDNGAMVAMAAYYKYSKRDFSLLNIEAKARLHI